MVHKLGYGNWDELKAAFRTSPLFRFDWFVKSRTTQELARRCDTLIRLVERENQEFDERERQARKEKKLSKVFVFCSAASTFKFPKYRRNIFNPFIQTLYTHLLYLNLDIPFFSLQNMTPSKRSMGRQAAESPPSNTKKRKQLLMDDYVSSVCCSFRFFH